MELFNLIDFRFKIFKNRKYFWILNIMLAIFSLIIVSPIDIYAIDAQFYTVQTGSFATDTIAAKQFYSLLKILDERGSEYLRIEKIRNLYAVRVGQFREYAAAEKFLRARSAQINGAIILKAHFNEERIVKLYIPGSEVDSADAVDNTVNPVQSENADTIQINYNKESSEGSEIATNRDEKHNDKDTRNTDSSFALAVSSRQSPKNKQDKILKKQSDIKGRFYISDYYSNDSNNFDFHVLTTRMKVYMRESNDSRYYFKLDARARKKVSDNDVHNDIPEYKFFEAWMGYKFPIQKVDLIAGRQYVQEMYNTSVDGINAKYRIRDYIGIGIFAGLAPDKYDYSFNSQFKTAGIYSSLDKDRYKLRFGYEKLYYDSKTDREYISFKLFSDLNKKTWFNLLSSASINQLTDNIDIDNLSTNLLYKYSRDLRFNLFYNYFSAIRYYESSKKFFIQNDGSDTYYLDTNSQSRIGFRVNYRIREKLTIYSSLAYQKRDIDDETAFRLTAGFRGNDFYGFDLSGRYTRINNFTSKSNEFNVEVSRLLLDRIDLSVYASHEKEELDIENGFTSGLLTYGASVYWSISKHYYASIFIERYDEDDYDNTSIFAQAGYRF